MMSPSLCHLLGKANSFPEPSADFNLCLMGQDGVHSHPWPWGGLGQRYLPQAGHVASQSGTEALRAETKEREWKLGWCGWGGAIKGPTRPDPFPSRGVERIKDV